MITSIIPELIVKNIETNITFFIKNFYFAVKQKEVINGKIKFAELVNGRNSLYLQAFEFTKREFLNFAIDLKSTNLILFEYENKKDVEKVYNKIKSDKIPIYSDIKDTDYGTKEFVVLSPDNYLIEVWCKL